MSLYGQFGPVVGLSMILMFFFYSKTETCGDVRGVRFAIFNELLHSD